MKFPPIDTKQTSELWISFLHKHEPDLSLIFTMKQSVLEFLLDFLVENLNNVSKGDGIEQTCGNFYKSSS